jgi:hypothetical protein
MPTSVRRLRPLRGLFRQGIFAVVAFLTPVFGVLYFFTIPSGTWPAVAATQAVATLLVVVAVVLYRRVAIWVEPGGIVERGFFGRTTRICAASIGSIVLVQTYVGAGAETVPQLFVADTDGTQVVRMRGQFWSLESMRTVSEVLDVPVVDLDQSLTAKELLQQYPGLLYWFERRPIVAAAAFSAAIIVAGIVIYGWFSAIGISPR